MEQSGRTTGRLRYIGSTLPRHRRGSTACTTRLNHHRNYRQTASLSVMTTGRAELLDDGPRKLTRAATEARDGYLLLDETIDFFTLTVQRVGAFHSNLWDQLFDNAHSLRSELASPILPTNLCAALLFALQGSSLDYHGSDSVRASRDYPSRVLLMRALARAGIYCRFKNNALF